ncbi:TIGR02594 family protein [Sphingomonas oleivorans]|uniref:TIGR02594 family protein n=1 Tax=Sphingomonas oleivorans TaxID=1735121 RepID=A0A2T5G1E4_9SPHN|nr:TIGR02594 family protein [Sphingomonas oleivorans]PTQ12969.1 TIGR02594 family protein [Sphingomonas oleivorans]
MTTEPAWLTAARAKLGTREAPGAANSATILGWARQLGVKVLGIAYNADGVPWCGLFVATCLREASVDLAEMRVAVRAKAWADWGANLRMDRLAPGAILVFDRPSGGHVGFYVGEDATHYHVLGGNQGDAVTIMRLGKGRCIARRWPKGVPVIGAPVWLSNVAGVPVSRNEA